VPQRYSERELWQRLVEVAAELGREPSQAEFWQLTGIHPLTVRRRLRSYGTWRDLARMAVRGGPLPEPGAAPPEVERERLVRDAIASVRAKLGRTPGELLYDTHRPPGAPTAKTIAQWFGEGRWSAALEALGFPPPPKGRHPLPRDALLRGLAQLWAELGREPTSGDIEAARNRIPGLVHPSQYNRRFGSLERARELARPFLEEVRPRGRPANRRPR